MRKASTKRSDTRARVRSIGRNLMMAFHVGLRSMYREQLRLTCPRREDNVKSSNACLHE